MADSLRSWKSLACAIGILFAGVAMLLKYITFQEFVTAAFAFTAGGLALSKDFNVSGPSKP